MARVLVIGGTGFIGTRVVAELVRLGTDVTVYSRGRRAGPGSGVRWIVAPDTTEVLHFDQALLSPTPQIVIHMIAMGEDEARAAAATFAAGASRLLVVSSGDVYLGYGRFIRSEPGPPEPVPFTEEAALRTMLYPYRVPGISEADLSWRYEKILAEQAVLAHPSGAVVRLPKVYGPGGNDELNTMYSFAQRPEWRWTHGYVDNVAAAIAHVALARALPRAIYNLGEEHTPTVAERLRELPPRVSSAAPGDFDFRQHIVLDTSAIRHELGFTEPVPYAEGIRRTLIASNGPAPRPKVKAEGAHSNQSRRRSRRRG